MDLLSEAHMDRRSVRSSSFPGLLETRFEWAVPRQDKGDGEQEDSDGMLAVDSDGDLCVQRASRRDAGEHLALQVVHSGSSGADAPRARLTLLLPTFVQLLLVLLPGCRGGRCFGPASSSLEAG